MSIKARGLFVDTQFERVKARSYDKFFAIGERTETDLTFIEDTWLYPIDVYVKENGYLGICSWNEDGTLFCASKSTDKGEYAEFFSYLLHLTLGDKVRRFSEKLREENLSAVFEVIDPDNDPHIIAYQEPHIVLLDLIYNEEEGFYTDCWTKSYEVLRTWGTIFSLPVKERVARIWTAAELNVWYTDVTSVGYKYNDRYIEGFVIEDFNNHRAKVKTDYYNFWKALRPAITRIRQDKEYINRWIDRKQHPELDEILAFLKSRSDFIKRYYELYHKDVDIIYMREWYESERE